MDRHHNRFNAVFFFTYNKALDAILRLAKINHICTLMRIAREIRVWAKRAINKGMLNLFEYFCYLLYRFDFIVILISFDKIFDVCCDFLWDQIAFYSQPLKLVLTEKALETHTSRFFHPSTVPKCLILTECQPTFSVSKVKLCRLPSDVPSLFPEFQT